MGTHLHTHTPSFRFVLTQILSKFCSLSSASIIPNTAPSVCVVHIVYVCGSGAKRSKAICSYTVNPGNAHIGLDWAFSRFFTSMTNRKNHASKCAVADRDFVSLLLLLLLLYVCMYVALSSDSLFAHFLPSTFVRTEKVCFTSDYGARYVSRTHFLYLHITHSRLLFVEIVALFDTFVAFVFIRSCVLCRIFVWPWTHMDSICVS